MSEARLDRWAVEEIPNYRSPGLVGARVVSEADIVCDISGAVVCGDWGRHEIHTARAHLIAAAPDLLEACRAYAEWMDRENGPGPDYGGLTRDTHPTGEAIWRKWYDETLDACARAQQLNRAAIAKATATGAGQ